MATTSRSTREKQLQDKCDQLQAQLDYHENKKRQEQARSDRNAARFWLFYLAAATITFGYEANSLTERSFNPAQSMGGGLGSAALWPLFWTWTLFDAVSNPIVCYNSRTSSPEGDMCDWRNKNAASK